MRNSYRALAVPAEVVLSPDLCTVQSRSLYLQKTDQLLGKDSGRASAVLVIGNRRHLLFLWTSGWSVRLLPAAGWWVAAKDANQFFGSFVHYCDTSKCGWCLFMCLK